MRRYGSIATRKSNRKFKAKRADISKGRFFMINAYRYQTVTRSRNPNAKIESDTAIWLKSACC